MFFSKRLEALSTVSAFVSGQNDIGTRGCLAAADGCLAVSRCQGWS